MNKSRIIAALLSIVLLAPFGAVQAGELEFKRISCRDATSIDPYFLLDSSSQTTNLTAQITRDACRPTQRSNPGASFALHRREGLNTVVAFISRRPRAPHEAKRRTIPPVSRVSIYFSPNGAARVSGTFDVKLIVD